MFVMEMKFHAGGSRVMTRDQKEPRTAGDIKKLLVIAFVILPICMVGATAAYGFVVWGLQMLWLGLPGA
jgi:nitrate reductase NapE